MHNLYIPVVLIVLSIVALLGYEYMGDSHVEDDIHHAINVALGTATAPSSQMTLLDQREVNTGYGVCGRYRLVVGQDEAAPFFYSKVDGNAELDAESRRYRMNCGE